MVCCRKEIVILPQLQAERFQPGVLYQTTAWRWYLAAARSDPSGWATLLACSLPAPQPQHQLPPMAPGGSGQSCRCNVIAAFGRGNTTLQGQSGTNFSPSLGVTLGRGPSSRAVTSSRLPSASHIRRGNKIKAAFFEKPFEVRVKQAPDLASRRLLRFE